MATLLESIKEQADWIVKAFAADRLTLDHTVHSFIEIDKFFNKHVREGKAVKNGRLSQNLGPILFSIGSYIGETIIKTVPGAAWEVDENDPEGEINATVRLPDGVVMWPMQKVIKRFRNGPEDSIYVYGHHITKDITKQAFDQDYWNVANPSVKKPWWKFWNR
jgi:hypothetical protein